MLISVAVAGGLVFAGRKYFRANQFKKKRLIVELTRVDPELISPPDDGLMAFDKITENATPQSLYHSLKKLIDEFNQKRLAPLTIRRQQMETINGGQVEISAAEKRLERDLQVALANVGIAGVSLLYPPLIILTLPGLIYNYIPALKLAITATVKERRVSSYVLDATLMTGLLFGGYLYIATVGSLFWVVGQILLVKNKNLSQQQIADLFTDHPRSVWIVVDGVEIEIPFEKLQKGDVIIISAGQTIPVDGKITAGFASIDQHKLTGEAQPAEKGVGETVLASTVVLAGKIWIETEKTGEETVARQIGVILTQTTDFKNSFQLRGEDIADKMVMPTLGVSLLAFPFLGMTGTLALLTNKVGSKMRFLAPASTLTFLNIASQQGILIKDGRSLDRLGQVDTFIFDKTGTLTLEQHTVGHIYACQGFSQQTVLQYAATAEDGQTHPIARAILAEANAWGIQWSKILDARYEVGYGIQVEVAEQIIQVGSYQFMMMEQILVPPEMTFIQENCQQQGTSLIFVACNNQLAGAIEIQTTPRPEARAIIDDLHQRNMSIYIISGDQEAPTKKLADVLGVDHYFANTLPEKKADMVEQLQQEGRTVCFVGDGINDSIALKKADISISLSGATTIAMDTAQIVLMDGTLRHLSDLLDMVHDFESNMKNNLLISTVPSALWIAGSLVFPLGVFTGVAVSSSVKFIGIGNATWPLLGYQQKRKQ